MRLVPAMPPFANPYVSTNPWLTAGESSESNSSYRTPTKTFSFSEISISSCK